MTRRVRLPKRFSGASLTGLERSQFGMVVEYGEGLRKSRKRPSKGILLAGPNGVGKTHSLAALTKVYVSLGIPHSDFEFLTIPDLIDLVPPVGMVMDEYRGKSWLSTLTNIPWLVLNDLGKEYRGGKLAEQVPYQIGRILRTRVERELTTHITTNMDGKTLSATYGPSIISLLSEAVDSYRVDGEDRRVAK